MGVEASMLCFVDENTIVPMESAQDYKRIFDGDKGPNTGGMGTYSPSLLFNEEVEQQIRESGRIIYADNCSSEPTEKDKLEILSDREKDIIKAVAKGLSNKEIADALFLSVHTVTTHRRNISNKLQIHTAAGLIIYAIANKLVNIEDIQ